MRMALHRRLVVLLPVALLLASPGWSKPRRKTPPSDTVTVAPSDEIDSRIDEEVGKAESLLANFDRDSLFSSPYLVSAVYYHDGFLSGYPADRRDLDPSGRIVARISRLVTAERKSAYIELLRALCDNPASSSDPQRLSLPVPDPELGRKRRRKQPHRYALDLFVPEGTPVRSVERGIVILAEGGWTAGDPFSTSSLRGGNSVIVFSPDHARFYRYCHLESISVAAGALVDAGQQVGAVGHTGFNAARKGHGHHLHFEVNEFNGQGVRALDKNQLQALLRTIGG